MIRPLPRPQRLRSWVLAGFVAGALCALPSDAIAQATGEEQEHHETPEPAGVPIVLRAFGSVQWSATQEPELPNSFTLGQFALFATSNLTDRISVLAEVVLEASTETRVVTDLERLQFTYRFNDFLQLSAGRYHTGIGFYNAAFHHGAFFETLIGRPRVFSFEDENGVLPVHDVGLTVRGEVPHTSSSLHYIAEMGNGRTWIQEDESSEGDGEQEVEHDSNDAKALNLGLSFHPERLRGFELGASYYRDSIRDVSDASIAHRVLATYLVYRTPSTEVMLEWLRLTHRPPGASEHVNHAGYVQFARAVGPAKPYYRYDRLSVNPSTPFIGAFESFAGHVAGVRFDPAQWVGLKAQYERTNQGSVRGIDAIRTQLVFVF